jgi:hypothetical protein
MTAKSAFVAVPPPAPTPKKPETDTEIAKRCLEFSASINTTQPVERPFSILADVFVKNTCDLNFPGEHVWATVAVRGDSAGVIGSDFGHFSGTITPYGSAQTMLEIQCDPTAARSLFAALRFFNP